MRILVCVKQAPAALSGVSVVDSRVRIDQRGGNKSFTMNRFDECAVEAAVRIKETIPGTVVDVVSVGPARVSEVIKRALGMGADNGIHVETGESVSLSPAGTAARIAMAVKDREYDLALAGLMSEDEMNCQTGPVVAELLGMPCATFAVALEVRDGEKEIYVEREVSGGTRECVSVKLPALVTVQAGINRPRYPSLSNVLRAEKAKIEIYRPEESLDSEYNGGIRIVGAEYPEKNKESIFIEGTRAEKAARLQEILREKHLVSE